MSHVLYAYPLKRTVALLTEDEYQQVVVHFRNRIRVIAKYCAEHGCSITEARALEPNGIKAMQMYEEMTGFKLNHPEEIYALPLSRYGRPCPSCSKPFRMPKAKLCAECGHKLPEGEVAGPLISPQHLLSVKKAITLSFLHLPMGRH